MVMGFTRMSDHASRWFVPPRPPAVRMDAVATIIDAFRIHPVV
jgi:hypothetical protein